MGDGWGIRGWDLDLDLWGGEVRVEVGLLFPKNDLSAGCEGGKWWELRKTIMYCSRGRSVGVFWRCGFLFFLDFCDVEALLGGVFWDM